MPAKSPATNPPVIPDRNNTGSIVRKAFIAEAVLNLLSFPLLTHPHWLLTHLLLHPSEITPSTIFFARCFGGIIIGGLTTALLIGATNTRNGVESRRPAYLILGIGEVILLPVLAAEAAKKGSREAALSVRGSLAAMGMLVPILAWRVYVLFVRPEMLGRYVEANEGGGSASGSGTKYGAIGCRDE